MSRRVAKGCVYLCKSAGLSSTKIGRGIIFFQSEKALKNRVFDERKMPLRYLPDAIMMLTFFDAVVIAIATCSYRDSNMMLST